MKTLLVVSLGLFYGGHGAGNSLLSGGISSGGFERGIISTKPSFVGGGVRNGLSEGSGIRGYTSYYGGHGVRGGLASLSSGDGVRGGFADSCEGVRPSLYEGGHTGNGFVLSGDKGHAIQ